MDTKEYILGKTAFLFNQQGEATTSLRQIAAFLEMSDGNLRYHYKSKEKMVLDLCNWMLEDMEQMLTSRRRKKEENVLAEVQSRFRGIFQIMYKYKFLFIESPLLLSKYHLLHKGFQRIYEVRKEFFTQLFEEYKAKGIISAQFDESFFNLLFEQFYIISDSWIKYIRLDKNGSLDLDNKIDHYITLCLSLLRPVLTEKGLAQLEEVTRNFSSDHQPAF